MDPKQLFHDERWTDVCTYCGSHGECTRDHVPSKVLLDEPYPEEMGVVNACLSCNNGFSLDEEYLACLIDCVVAGGVESTLKHRPKISKILNRKPILADKIKESCCIRDDHLVWDIDINRVSKILLKLARGHFAYECAEILLSEPNSILIKPLMMMSEEELINFETEPSECILPEIGSRMFKSIYVNDAPMFFGWNHIQENRYRYLVSWSDSPVVRIVLSEYLACEVTWL